MLGGTAFEDLQKDRFLVGLVGIVDLLQVVVPDDVRCSVLVDKLLELRVENAIDRLQAAVHG